MRTIHDARARHVLRAVLLAAAISLIAASCGGDDDAGEPGDEPEGPAPDISEQGDPVEGGSITVGLEAETSGWLPGSGNFANSGVTVAFAIYDPLARLDENGEIQPYLAESIEPSDDLTEWTVTLREGIEFHDGTPLDSAAIQTNFEAQVGDPLIGLAVRPFYPAENRTEIIDDLTIQFNLLDENAQFPKALTGQLGYVASPTWLAAALEDPTLNQQPVGTGPFVFDSRSADSVTRFVRNENWWNGEVYLDAIEFVPVTDPDARADLFFNGDLNALHTSNPPTVEDLREDESVQNVIDETGEDLFIMINSAAPPFDDIRARQALTFATPRQQYNDLIDLGLARQADQQFTPESRFYNPDVQQEGDMPDEALALVEEYCAERGTEQNPVLGTTTCTDGKINVEWQWSGPSVVLTQAADLFDNAWSSAGFNVTFDELPQDDVIAEAVTGAYNAVLWRSFGAKDPANDNVWFLCRTIDVVSLNFPRYCDEARDQLLLDAAASTDEEERIGLYQQFVEQVNQAYTYVFLSHSLWNNAFAENVRGACDATGPDNGEPLLCTLNGRNWFDSFWIDR